MLVQGITFLFLALQATASPYHRQTRFRTSDNCPSGDGVHIIGIRGTLEQAPYGALQEVVDKLMDQLPGSDNKAIDYPASGVKPPPQEGGDPEFNFIEYRSSEQYGLDKLTEEIITFDEDCPESGIVLLGYSQGGHIIGDALCGRYGSLLFPSIAPVDPEYLRNVRAIVQLGDPTNRYDVPWHVGNSTRNGIFPRADFSPCRQYGDFWESYCDANDFFCDFSKQSTIAVHLTYVKNYADKIVDFVVGKVKENSKARVHKSCVEKDLRI